MRYKLYKNKLTCIIRASEKLYYKNKFLENKNSLKNTWSLINELINAPKTECCIHELNIDGILTNDNHNIVNKLNEYFVNVGPNLAKKIPDIDGCYTDYMRETSVNMFMTPTDYFEISDIINELHPNKSAGFDEISPKIIKLACHL
jgi:hypothetical protein